MTQSQQPPFQPPNQQYGGQQQYNSQQQYSQQQYNQQQYNQQHQQQQYGGQQYGQYQAQNRPINNAVMTVGNWIGTIILTGIPILGFILLLVWAFDSTTNINKKNYAKAALILMLIGIVLWIILGAAIGATVFSAFRRASTFY